MDRRDFCKLGVGGLATAAAAGLPAGADAAAKPLAKVDPDKLAASAVKYLIERKRTCAEAILAAGCDGLGIRSDLIPDIALGLGGGVGCQGRICGLVTGGAMVLSLAMARKQPDYAKRMMPTLMASGEYFQACFKALGTCNCRKLSGLDLTTPQGRMKLKTSVKAKVCSKYVNKAARILAEHLNKL